MTVSERADLRRRFLVDGFVHVPGLLSASEMAALKGAHSDIMKRGSSILKSAALTSQSLADYYRHSGETLIVVPERGVKDTICRFEYLCGFSPVMKNLVTTRLLSLVEEVAGERCTLFKDKCNEKPPSGGAFEPHQDFAAYMIFPPRRYTTAMLAIDEATLENGCLQFAEHYLDLARANPAFVGESFDGYPLFRYSRGGPNNGNIEPGVSSQMRWTPVPVRCGDVVVFDAFVPHYSEPNASQTQRRALFFTFNATRYGEFYEAYYQAKRQRYDDPAFHVATPTEHAASAVVS
jgi:2-aminoethylphosphonate dioxygenase